MIKNLLRIALRNLKKDTWYSLLNIIGLTIGITFSLFLVFYIKDELNYDRYNKNADRIVRIVSHVQERDKNTDFTVTQAPLAAELKRDYPEVEESARFMGRERTLFKVGDKDFYETKVYYADSTIFKIFTFKFIEGDPHTALNEPNSVVLTRSIAEKYFGKNASALGKSVHTIYDVYKVTGVIEDIPHNAHLRYDMLISWTSMPKNMYGGENWGNFNNFTYVLLKPGTSAAAFEKKLIPMYDKFMAPIFAASHVKIYYGVQPITKIHLHSKLELEPEELGSMSYILIFSAVAFFMILIASINYMNLTTARSARRAKEIGIRKVTGSSRRLLIFQFLGESVLIGLLSVLLSVLLLMALLPFFDSLSGKAFTIGTIFQPSNLLLLLSIGLFTGFAGGSYPAFYLSAFKPVSILKGALSKASGNINLRRTLVVLQFAISMIMLICTWVVYSQLSFLQKKNLGFNKDQVMTVVVNTGKDERPKINAMDNDFRSVAGVQSVGTGSNYPGGPNLNLNLFSVQTDSGYADKGIECYSADENYLKVLNIPVVQGRDFSGLSDTAHGVMVNESFVKHFNWGQNAVGKRIKFPGDTSGQYLEVVGVVKDFNQKSLYNPISPLLLYYGADNNMIDLKMNTTDLSSSISKVSAVWKKYFPDLPFEYKFLDDDFNSQYAADQKRGKIFASFAVLTIIITCLGLLGLTAFTTQQKQKEISIRRIMGATIPQIIGLITRNYLWLALIAAAIAFPVAWYFMSNWLKIFSYSPGLSVIPFLLSATIIIITAIATATFHCTRAALAKPAESLRTE